MDNEIEGSTSKNGAYLLGHGEQCSYSFASIKYYSAIWDIPLDHWTKYFCQCLTLKNLEKEDLTN